MKSIIAVFLFMGCGTNLAFDKEPIPHNPERPGMGYVDSCKAALFCCDDCHGDGYREGQRVAEHSDTVEEITDGKEDLS